MILPAAAPTILTGMRISVGIAWLVIVAAEMLVGGTGIGYFVWNEWNNLSIANILCGILAIGLVGMALDVLFARLHLLGQTTETVLLKQFVQAFPVVRTDLGFAPIEHQRKVVLQPNQFPADPRLIGKLDEVLAKFLR